MFLPIVVLLLLHSCHGSMSGRGTGGFDIDQTGDTDPCAGQTAPSPQCPSEKEEEEKKKEEEEGENPAGSGEQEVTGIPPQLGEYNDNKWGSITVDPLTMQKDTEGQLRMTFTAGKKIEQGDSVVLRVYVRYRYNLRTDNITVSPDAAKDFFTAMPSAANNYSGDMVVTTPIKAMDAGDQFTFTLTFTPTEDFDFSAGTDSDTFRFFKNARREKPKITVYEGSTPPNQPPPDLSPIYTNGKLEVRLKPWPHKIKKDTESELIMVFTAVGDYRRREGVKDNAGRQKAALELNLGAVPRPAVSRYSFRISRQPALAANRHVKIRKPVCRTNPNIAQECELHIIELEEGDTFELKLTVKASENFNLGLGGLKKKLDDINPELNGKPPLIIVE